MHCREGIWRDGQGIGTMHAANNLPVFPYTFPSVHCREGIWRDGQGIGSVHCREGIWKDWQVIGSVHCREGIWRDGQGIGSVHCREGIWKLAACIVWKAYGKTGRAFAACILNDADSELTNLLQISVSGDDRVRGSLTAMIFIDCIRQNQYIKIKLKVDAR